MRKLADLHLRPNLRDREQVKKVLSKVSELGFDIIGISLPIEKVRQDTIGFLQKASGNCGVDISTRVDLAPRSSSELLRSIRKVRRKFELVAVECSSKSVARQAAKDNRVDLLVFSSNVSHGRFFDYEEARLASQSYAALEINIAPLLDSAGSFRARLLSSLRRETTIAMKIGVPVVICSGAVDSYQLRSPYDFIGLASLFGMVSATALGAISAAPSIIVERNRRKLDSGYVAKGISVVGREKKCG